MLLAYGTGKRLMPGIIWALLLAALWQWSRVLPPPAAETFYWFDYPFMRRAVPACIAAAGAGAFCGVFVVLRRLTPAGDMVGHAVLPGVAAAYLLSGGLAPLAMTAGSLVAALLIAGLAGLAARISGAEASLTAVALAAPALGVLLLAQKTGAPPLLDILFGNPLTLDNDSVSFGLAVSALTPCIGLFFYRTWFIGTFSPESAAPGGRLARFSFAAAAMMQAVAGFRTVGTMTALSLAVFPALSVLALRLTIDKALAGAVLLGMLQAIAGLYLSWITDNPAGACISLCGAGIYAVSVLSVYRRKQ